MTLVEAIAKAEQLLPGTPVDEGIDPRWQAIIAVGEYIETEPEAVWQFVERWGDHAQRDLRAAISTCLLEHLLQSNFDLIFPKVESAVFRSPRFADTFCSCAKFGQSRIPENEARFDRLAESCHDRRAT